MAANPATPFELGAIHDAAVHFLHVTDRDANREYVIRNQTAIKRGALLDDLKAPTSTMSI